MSCIVKVTAHPPSDIKYTLSMLGCVPVCVYVCMHVYMCPESFLFSECDHILDDT